MDSSVENVYNGVKGSYNLLNTTESKLNTDLNEPLGLHKDLQRLGNRELKK